MKINIREFSMIFIKISGGMAFLGMPLSYIFSHYFGMDPSQLLSCTNQGKGMFFWQVASRYMLALLSIVMNLAFFLDNFNANNQKVFHKAKTDSLVIGLIIYLVAFVYLVDGIIHYRYFCGTPKTGWAIAYVVSFAESIMLHFDIFFIVFISISICKRMSKNG